jgi:hypothetical protein
MATTVEPRSKTLTPESRFLALEEVVRILHLAETMDHGDWGRLVHAWVRDELAPAAPGEPVNDDTREEHP